MESTNIPPESTLPEDIKSEELNTNNLSLEEPKDLVEPPMEEVRVESVESVENVESVDVNTQTVTEETKPKSPSYLEKKIETVKKFFLYYMSCSVKKTEPNNNEPK